MTRALAEAGARVVVGARPSAAAGGAPGDVAAQAAAQMVTGRFSTPAEVAALVRFLAGTGAADITGGDMIIDTMATSPRQHDLVRGIIQMAGTLSPAVVAEGVETSDEHRMPAEAGCEYGQGYLFARPFTPEAARERPTRSST